MHSASLQFINVREFGDVIRTSKDEVQVCTETDFLHWWL